MNYIHKSLAQINKKGRNSTNTFRPKFEESTRISENNFNILKYLNELERKNTIKTKKKFNLKSLPILNLRYQGLHPIKVNKSVNLNNILTLKNEKFDINNNNDDGCFLTSLEIEKENSYNQNNHNTINKNKLKNGQYGYKKYNLNAIIKDIKNKNNSYVSKTEGNYFNDYLAYDNKSMRSILDINNIINEHLKNEEWDLKEREDKYHDFIDKNKGICVKNLIIKIMNEEKRKILKKDKEYLNEFQKKYYTIKKGEQVFEQVIVDQKKNTKLIEDNYYKLKNDNKILIILRENFKEQVRKTEYEILKKIYEIDELRLYAKFIHYIYGFDYSIYEKNIIDKDYNKNPEETEILINTVIENYKHFLTDKNDEIINNIDPDIILNEIILIEDRILLNLKLRDQEYEDLKKCKNNYKNILKNIEYKKNQLEDDYRYYKKELSDIKINRNLNLDEDLFLITAKKLFIFILEQYSNDKKLIKKYSGNLNLFELSDLAEKSMEFILKKESILDKYLETLEKADKEEPKLFNTCINKRKEDIIREKTIQSKNNIQRIQFLENMNIQNKSNKICFVNRYAIPTLPRKKEKIAKIPPEILKQIENKELITYK